MNIKDPSSKLNCATESAIKAFGKGEQTGHIYSRNTNPTVAAFEEKLRLLEGAEAVECSAAERAAMGIPESLVRYSTGIEDADDLIADLDRALSKIA